MIKIIDGKALAKKKERLLKEKVLSLKQKGVELKLASIVMEGDEAGELYIGLKRQAAERMGIKLTEKRFRASKIEKIKEEIKRLNKDDAVQGIMVQRPSVAWGGKQGMTRDEFESWWEDLVSEIRLKKDVDGLTRKGKFLPATVKAVMEILRSINLKQGQVVVVGSKGLVGRELVKQMKSKSFKVKGMDLGEAIEKATKRADILISATGKKGLITTEMVKKGAVVIDVGWPKGDVDFEGVIKKASMITPVPGGVGPLTVVSLLENLVKTVYIS